MEAHNLRASLSRLRITNHFDRAGKHRGAGNEDPVSFGTQGGVSQIDWVDRAVKTADDDAVAASKGPIDGD